MTHIGKLTNLRGLGRRSVLVFMLTSAAGALFLTQCGDSNLGTPADGGVIVLGDAAASCPSNPPTPGTACTLPSGTNCNNYPQPGCECCGNGGYFCQNGTWQEVGGPPSGTGLLPGCPGSLPEAGATCSYLPCSGTPQFCSFTCDNGGNASATCSSTGQWQITELGSCDGDAGLDAGDAGD